MPTYLDACAFEARGGERDASAESDVELARRVVAGDPDALALVYDRHAPSLYRMLQAMLRSSADAEDALQEVFAKLASGRAAKMHDLKSYLFVAARNEALSVLRRRKREPTEPVDEELPAPTETSASTDTDWRLLLARLPLEQREVIVLKVWEGLTFAEIARIVKASPNTVMSRYRYGIERLRTWCQQEDL